MTVLVYVLMGLAMLLALGFVFLGLFVMARGGEANRRWGNRLMRYRIIAQSAAIALFALGFLLSQKS